MNLTMKLKSLFLPFAVAALVTLSGCDTAQPVADANVQPIVADVAAKEPAVPELIVEQPKTEAVAKPKHYKKHKSSCKKHCTKRKAKRKSCKRNH